MKKEKYGKGARAFLIFITIAFLTLVIFSEKIFGTDSFLGDKVLSLDKLWQSFLDFLPSVVGAIFSILVTLIIQNIVRSIIRRTTVNVKKGKSVINLIDSFVKYATGIILIFILLSAVGIDTKTLLAGAGILTLVVGLGSQQLIQDIISGLFLVFEKTFDIDDIVEIDGFRGTVKEIGIRTTRIIDAGGDTKIVSNSEIRSIVNLTADLSLAICKIGIEYGESIERVENVIKQNLDKIKDRIPTICDGLFYKGVSELKDSAVELMFLAKCKEEDKFQTVRDLNREIKIVFDKNKINVPFPQVVVNRPKDFDKVSEHIKRKANEFVDEQREVSKNLEDFND